MSGELKALEPKPLDTAIAHVVCETADSGGSLAAAEASGAGLSDRDILQEGVLPESSDEDRTDEESGVSAEEGDDAVQLEVQRMMLASLLQRP